jgi:menaquinone-dependent protoporphyrinogen IX oxidase
MKALVAYYSWTGTTRQVAKAVATGLGCESEEIREPKPRSMGLGFAIAGMQSSMHLRPRILDVQHDLAQYDLVIVGTPIWAWNMSSPVRSFLGRYKGQLKKVAFFWSSGGAMEDKPLAQLEGVCGKKAVAAMGLLAAAVPTGEYMAQVQDFVAKLKR